MGVQGTFIFTGDTKLGSTDRHSISVMDSSFSLIKPFFVLQTSNPSQAECAVSTWNLELGTFYYHFLAVAFCLLSAAFIKYQSHINIELSVY
jgi:hypothetical protein